MAAGTAPRRRPRRLPGLALAAALSAALAAARWSPLSWSTASGARRSPSPRACSSRGRPLRTACGAAAEADTAVAEPQVSELVKLADISERPWEALEEKFQLEARRCWAERADGKVRGFIANLLPGAAEEERDMSPFEIASLRRTWKPAEDEGLVRMEHWVSDPYMTLGVNRSATLAEVKKAYLAKAREHHPDKGGNPERFQEVLLAYRILRDDDRRGHFDKTGGDAGDDQTELQYVRVPALAVLRQGILEHDELYLSKGYELLAEKVGSVQFDYPERLLTQAVFDLGDKGEVVAWLPRQILIVVEEDGTETPLSGDQYQREGLVLQAKQDKLMKMAQAKQNQYLALAEYVDGWRGIDPPVRDVGHGNDFFTRGRETEGGVVLDLGCGSGIASNLFAKGRSFSVVFGLDNNRTALFEARESAEMDSLGPEQGLYLIRADAYELPFRDYLVDNVWWGFGWEDMDRPEDVLQEVLRVLRRGGRLAVASAGGYQLAMQIKGALEAAGFEETSIYPPRHGVFLNYASKPE